jgi:hypothetical protein
VNQFIELKLSGKAVFIPSQMSPGSRSHNRAFLRGEVPHSKEGQYRTEQKRGLPSPGRGNTMAADPHQHGEIASVKQQDEVV